MENSIPSTTNSRSLGQVMREHRLISFFVMAYAFSWVMSIPYILGQWGLLHGNLQLIFVLKSFGPFLSAYIMTRLLDGKAGAQRLTRRLRQVRAGWQWYAFILLGIPALALMGMGLLPGALASFQGFPPNFAIVYIITFVLIFFGGGPLGEEPGWRGFALPRLQTRYGALRGTLLLGVLWTFWHLPDFLTDAQRGGPGKDLLYLLTVNLPIFLVMVTSMAILFTWFYNHTRDSLFIAVLLHASINGFGTFMALFSAPSVFNSDLAICLAMLAPALLIVILTRGRLGFKTDQGQAIIPEEVERLPQAG